jgi:hypothetical protein
MTTTMYRKTACTNCHYTQETFLSYYLDRKQWNKGHDLDKCRSIRKEANGFDELFAGTLESLAKLTIIK